MSERNMGSNGRRGFLRVALAGVSAAVVAGCDKLGATSWFAGLLRSGETLTRATQRLVVGDRALAQEFTESDVTGPFRSNGTSHPLSAAYDALAANGFADWRLQVDGLVAHPAKFSLDELKAMPSRTQITRHDCVEGWSCDRQVDRRTAARILARVQPEPSGALRGFPLCRSEAAERHTAVLREHRHDRCPSPADDPGIRTQRHGASDRERRTDPRAHRAPARLQDGQVHHADRTGRRLRRHSRRQRRLLGRPWLRVVRRNLTHRRGDVERET